MQQLYGMVHDPAIEQQQFDSPVLQEVHCSIAAYLEPAGQESLLCADGVHQTNC